MESFQQRPPDEMVRVTLDLPLRVVAWLDAIKDRVGVRSRGALVAQLLEEIALEQEPFDTEGEAPARATS